MAKLLDKANQFMGQVQGIFSNNTVPEENKDSEINTPDEEKLVKMVEYDYNVFKEKRDPMADIWRKEQRMDKGDHWTGLRPPDNGVYPERMEYIGNYAWSQCESIKARLTGWVPKPEFEATEEDDEDKANMLNQFIPYELNQIKFKPKHVRAVGRMVVHGVLLYKIIYDPTIEGGRGANRWNGQCDIIPLNYGAFFPDPAVKDFIYMQTGRAHIINNLCTIQYVRERWPDQGPKVLPDNRSADTEIYDMDDVSIVGTTYGQEDNQTTTNVLEYWYKGTPKFMSDEDIKLFKGLADQNIQDGLDPSVNLAKSKGTMKGIHCIYTTTGKVFLEHKSYVYDHGQYPFVARTLFPEENNPWGKGYMRDMISPQTFYNRFVELAAEVTAKMGNAVILYGTAAGITEAFKQIWKRFRSQAGAMLPVQGDVNQVKELQGVPPNPGIMQYIEHFLTMMQKIPGMFDSSNGAANANVNSGEQAKALIDASQGRLSLPSELIEDALREVIEQFVELCAQFYTSERVARITGKTISFSRDKMVKQAPTETETGEMNEENEPINEPTQEEYIPKFDVTVNIGVEKPKDRQYFINLAFQMFQMVDPTTQMPLIDAKAVKFAVENGFMEPLSVIEERMHIEQKQFQMIQQLQQKAQQDQQQIEVMHQMLVEAEKGKDQMLQDQHNQQNDNQTEAMKTHAEMQRTAVDANAQQMQAQQQLHQQEMDKQKMDIAGADMILKTHQALNPPQKETVGSGKK